MALVALAATVAYGDTTPRGLPFAQGWSDTDLIGNDDDWSGVPGIVGYRGDGLTTSTGTDPQTVLADGTETPVDVNANQVNPDILATGGVAEFELADPTVALNGSGTADAPFLLLTLSTLGWRGITVSYDLRDLDGSPDDSVQPVALHFRVGTTGPFTNVPAAFVADATAGPSLAGLVTPVAALLPPAADDQPVVQLRIMTTNAAGNDEWVGVDAIQVTGAPTGSPTPPSGVGAADPAVVDAGEATRLTVAVTPGMNPESTGLAVTADLTAIGGPAAQPFFDDGTHGDAAPGDDVFSFEATVAAAVSPVARVLPAGITDAESRAGATSITVSVRSEIVISQVYGGGGNSGATLRNDFVELFNQGPATSSLEGWSVQYASAAGTSWQKTDLTGSILPGGHYLVQEAMGAGGTVDLPPPDATGGIAMAAGAGKVALVGGGTLLAGSGCPLGASVLDFVGYGSGASCSEGGPAPSPGNTTAVFRVFGGCQDTNHNAADFATGAPAPRNGASPAQSCVPVSLAIHEIQGDGSRSPHEGALVRTRGVVTGRKANGFFVQAPDGEADADPATSEGVFVFTSGPPPAEAEPGSAVEVVGFVEEFVPSQDPYSPPTTEISGPPIVTRVSTGDPLPEPVTLTAADTDPAGSVEQLERYEGMRVHVASLTAVSPTQGSIDEVNAASTTNGVFYGVITGVGRPFREPGVPVGDALPPDAPCCVPRFDGNPERLRVDSDAQPGARALEVTSGALVSGLTGPLDFAFRTYTILPDPPPADPPSVSGNRSAVPVREAAGDEFTVASFNLERFFDDVDDPAIGEPVLTPAAFERRLAKASLAVRDVMRAPDILGVEEVENLDTLRALAARISADAVAAGQPDPAYEAYLQEGNDVGGIDVGVLAKAPPRVEVTSVTQVGRDATFPDPDTGLLETLNDRPPLVLRATVHPPSGPPVPVTVIVNHLRSLLGIDDPVDGRRVRAKRRAQAEFLAGLIQARQLADPAERIVSVGDYNAYPFNDGYVDSIGTIEGRPTDPAEVVLASDDLVEPDLVDLAEQAPPGERYSFTFDGNAQLLDHVIVTRNLLPALRDFRHARSDADFPESLRNDPLRPERVSDHDMPVAYFSALSLGATRPARLFVGLADGGDEEARFDLRAALYVNGVLAADGETLCVTGLGRGPARAREVAVPFGPVSGGALAAGDVLSLKVYTRSGTRPDGSPCGGRRRAGGLRLYYDSLDRASRFGLEIAPSPLTDQYLHSKRRRRFFDTTAPTSRHAEAEGSCPSRSRKGNPWVEVGAWHRVVLEHAGALGEGSSKARPGSTLVGERLPASWPPDAGRTASPADDDRDEGTCARDPW